MDKNTFIGLGLIFAILIGFSYFNRPSQEEIELAKRRSDSLALVRAENEKEYKEAEFKAQQKSTAVDSAKLSEQMGSFSKLSTGETKYITLENEYIRLKISTRGGRIYSAEIKGYKTYSGDSLALFTGNNNVFGLQFWGDKNDIKTQDLFFSPSTSDSTIIVKEGDNPYSLTMRLAIAENSSIDFVYTIPPKSHLIDFNIHFTGMDNIITARVGSIDLLWENDMLRLEKGKDNESKYTTIAYRYPNGEVETMSATSDKEEEKLTTKVQWVGFKHQYFSTFIVADQSFSNADLTTTKLGDEGFTKRFVSRLALPFEKGADETIKFKMYFGPNHFNTLKGYEYGFEEVVPLGWSIIRWVNYGVVWIFDILDNKIASYGLIIFLLTVFIKLILFPLTFKSYVSQAKMRVLKPQIDEINGKFPKKEDALKKQQAVMGLYKKVGVSPLGGCLPMLIQFPILFAMFQFFPASFELRQESFLWADDLSSYDSILNLPFSIPFYGDHVSLFTILMAVALFFTTRISAEQMSDTNAQLPGMKFMMLYVMPIMLLFFFNNYSSGLSYYYFLSNAFTLGQTYLIRQFVDDAKILAKLHENAKKPIKRSKFQEKLEALAKQQEQQQKLRKR